MPLLLDFFNLQNAIKIFKKNQTANPAGFTLHHAKRAKWLPNSCDAAAFTQTRAVNFRTNFGQS